MVIFDGVKYYKNKDGYMEASGPTRGKPRHPFNYLHQAVWVKHNGPIPAGHAPHHIDENKENNEIGNLQLLTNADHCRLHVLAYWKKKRETTRICKECGKETTRLKWCGQICINRDAARRKYHAIRNDKVKWEAYLKKQKEKYIRKRTSSKPYRAHQR